MPETASFAIPQSWRALSRRGPGAAPSASPVARRMPRRHLMLLVLAMEVLFLGWRNADRYRPPGIPVEQTVAAGHIIT